MARGASRPQCASMDTVMDLRAAAARSRPRRGPARRRAAAGAGAGGPRSAPGARASSPRGRPAARRRRRRAAARGGEAPRPRLAEAEADVRAELEDGVGERELLERRHVAAERPAQGRDEAQRLRAAQVARHELAHARQPRRALGSGTRARATRAHGDARRVQARRHDLQHLRRLVEGAHWPRRTDRAAPGPDTRDKKAPRSTLVQQAKSSLTALPP